MVETEDIREKFSKLKTAADVAAFLDIEKNRLNYYLYILPNSRKYKSFMIKKRNGGTREITAPITALKMIQQKLNKILQEIYVPKRPVHCFIPGESILKNAKPHVKQKWVLNIDLENFFPTITFRRVRGMFLKKPYELGEKAATILAQICTFDSKLPQGAPTSPIITNMICSKLDNEIYRLVKKYGCVYTRYADDISISSSDRDFPETVAKYDLQNELELGDEIKEIISDNGFQVNMGKLKLARNNVKQQVTGLVVNEKVNIRRSFIRQVRGMLHAWERFGYQQASKDFLNLHYRKNRLSKKGKPSFRYIINGKLGFMKMILGEHNPVFQRYYNQYRRLCLVEKYNRLKKTLSAQRRGYLLQDFMKELLGFYSVNVTESFVRNSGAEQIDGAFEIDGGHYIVECRWRNKLANVREVDGLYGQIGRSGTMTRGLFLSINGWSTNVESLLKQNPGKVIALMNGSDISNALEKRIDIKDFLREKAKHLSLRSEPYCSVETYEAIKNGQ